LTDEEGQTLHRWARRRRRSQPLALRCRIVLACAEACPMWRPASGWACTRPRSASGPGGSPPAGWKGWWTSHGRGAPHDHRHPGGAGDHHDLGGGPDRRHALVDARHGPGDWPEPDGDLEDLAGVGLKPHLDEAWKLSTDPQFIDKVRDVVGLELNPPDAAVVLCADEKSGIQALDRTAPVLPLLPGVARRRSHDYAGHGPTNLYPALEVASGKVISQMTRRHRAIECKQFLARIDQAVPGELDVQLIVENSSTHKRPAIQRWLVAHPRFHVHFTPPTARG
jgi:hypothetical protein